MRLGLVVALAALAAAGCAVAGVMQKIFAAVVIFVAVKMVASLVG